MLTCIQCTFFCIYAKLMFLPSKHLVNFTHAHLHTWLLMGFLQKWGRGVRILGRPEWSGLYMLHVGAGMKWPQLLGACEHGQCAPQARCACVRTQNTRCVTPRQCSRVLSLQNAYKMHRVSEMNGSCQACLLWSS